MLNNMRTQLNKNIYQTFNEYKDYNQNSRNFENSMYRNNNDRSFQNSYYQ